MTPCVAPPAPPAPPSDCPDCPRLAAFRKENRRLLPEFFNAPVPSFGPTDARLLIVGLAPGLRGANRTGRPFTGDFAGDLLYQTLLRFGFASGHYDRRPEDGLRLLGVRITNAVRCVPPANKPETIEIRTCRAYLTGELNLPGLTAVLALGRIAHDAVLAARGLRRARFPFAHGAHHEISSGLLLADSYHCSRYNQNTGRLTPDMFEEIVSRLRIYIENQESAAQGSITT